MRNWAGNIEYRAGRLLEPGSVEELQEAVRASRRLRVLGSRHAFSDIADTTGDHVSLARLPRVLAVDVAARTATVDGAVRYGELCPALDASGLAVQNLASLPHISVAGACATATHGSGDRLGTLSTAVSALEVVRGDGELVTLSRAGDPEVFPGAVVSLGAMGAVTRLTLDLVPATEVAQVVYERLPVATYLARFDDVTATGDSVSAFTTWGGDVVDQVWVKRHVAPGQRPAFPESLFGARPATGPLHPVPGMDVAACTGQLGEPGRWHERLPHFRLDHTPSAGDELQTEYFVERADAPAAFEAVLALRERIAPLVFTSEIRTVAADDLWLSPAYRRDSVGIHFTWRPRWPEVRALLPAIEAALEPFGPRPHWAKLSSMAPAAVSAAYPRLADARDLATALDPRGTLRNAFVDRYLFGGPAGD